MNAICINIHIHIFTYIYIHMYFINLSFSCGISGLKEEEEVVHGFSYGLGCPETMSIQRSSLGGVMLVSNLQMSKGATQKESGTTRASRGKGSGQFSS